MFQNDVIKIVLPIASSVSQMNKFLAINFIIIIILLKTIFKNIVELVMSEKLCVI